MKLALRWQRDRLLRLARALALWGLGAGALLFALLTIVYASIELPEPLRASSLVVADRRGEILSIRRSAADSFRIPVDLEAVAPALVDATLAVEDRRFHQHPGVDPIALVRALRDNLLSARRVSGASTLTMQLVRLMQPRPRNYRSKVLEILTAVKLERVWSKRRILSEYLNSAPYGSNLVGCEAAAWRWFGKRARDLDLAEAALLAGLPQAPERLRPDRHPAAARRRRDHVLQRMHRTGCIDAAELGRALEREVCVSSHPWPDRAPHAVRLARRRSYALANPSRERLATTIDLEIQYRAQAILSEAVARYRPDGVHNGAVVVLENATGAIRALVGSADCGDRLHGGEVDAATAQRSPGSTLKPFLYALAFENGAVGYSERLANRPQRMGDYLPENFDRTFSAPIPAHEALARSLNLPAVEVLRRVGLDAFLRLLAAAGLERLWHERGRFGLSLPLGACELSPLELATAYAALGRGGLHLPARILAAREAGEPRRILSRGAVALAHRALSDPAHSPLAGGGFECRNFLAKTGTSYAQRDAWLAACSRRWTVVVWIGNVEGTPAELLVGRLAAAPVARDMISVLPGIAGDAPPLGAGTLEPCAVCPQSGLAPRADCPAVLSTLRARGLPLRHCGERHLAAPEAPARQPMRILSPLPGAPYCSIDADERELKLPLRAEAAGARELYWFLDGRMVARSTPQEEPAIPVGPGRHRLRCLDERGRSAVTRFSVRVRAGDSVGEVGDQQVGGR